MESKHVAVIVGAGLLGLIGFYLIKRVVGSARAVPSIDDQLRSLQ